MVVRSDSATIGVVVSFHPRIAPTTASLLAALASPLLLEAGRRAGTGDFTGVLSPSTTPPPSSRTHSCKATRCALFAPSSSRAPS
jgi:hypothetical protein